MRAVVFAVGVVLVGLVGGCTREPTTPIKLPPSRIIHGKTYRPPPESTAPTPESAPTTAIAPITVLAVGSLGELRLPGGSGVWLATTEGDWDDLMEAERAGAAGSGSLMLGMAEAGRARKYPNGTAIVVLKTAPLSAFVEVTDGEDKGRSGWVQREFVSLPPLDRY